MERPRRHVGARHGVHPVPGNHIPALTCSGFPDEPAPSPVPCRRRARPRQGRVQHCRADSPCRAALPRRSPRERCQVLWKRAALSRGNPRGAAAHSTPTLGLRSSRPMMASGHPTKHTGNPPSRTLRNPQSLRPEDSRRRGLGAGPRLLLKAGSEDTPAPAPRSPGTASDFGPPTQRPPRTRTLTTGIP